MEVSEACKKILINYLQVVSLAAVFPVRWPVAVENFFAFQSTISSISKTLLSPDCELSHVPPAVAFYQKQVGFAFLPVFIIFVCNFFWFVLKKVRHCRGFVPPDSEYYSDRAVLSWVTLLYLAYRRK